MAGPDVVRDTADTIVFLLRGGIPPAMVDPTRILVATPDEFESLRDPAHPNITVFLYRIGINPEMRNNPRRLLPDGRLQRQPLPLELCFLITAWAKDKGRKLRPLPATWPAAPEGGVEGAPITSGRYKKH